MGLDDVARGQAGKTEIARTEDRRLAIDGYDAVRQRTPRLAGAWMMSHADECSDHSFCESQTGHRHRTHGHDIQAGHSHTGAGDTARIIHTSPASAPARPLCWVGGRGAPRSSRHAATNTEQPGRQTADRSPLRCRRLSSLTHTQADDRLTSRRNTATSRA